MNYKDDYATAAKFLKQSVAIMGSHTIAAHPINYALWYNYVSESLPALKKALDRILASPLGFSEEQARELYNVHIIGSQVQNHQESLAGITEIAASLLSRLNGSLDDSEQFDQNLDENLTRLKDLPVSGELASMVNLIVKSTEAMAESNRSFREKTEEAKLEIDQLKGDLEVAQRQAYFDTLTQLYNRFAFDKQLDQLLSNDDVAIQTCLILMDLDHFKSFNDDYGHLIGDRVLQKAGEILQEDCPDNAICARYGGEEFAIIVSNSGLTEAAAIAEDIRQRLAKLRVRVKSTNSVLDNISASFGVALYQQGEDRTAFIDRADKALYRAKHQGRNRVETDEVSIQAHAVHA